MVKWSIPAKNDLKQIHDYIAKDSKHYAIIVTNKFQDKIEILNKFPKIGRVVPEINNENIRELFIYSYRLIYEIKSTDIDILTIVHGKRDFTSDKINELLQ